MSKIFIPDDIHKCTGVCRVADIGWSSEIIGITNNTIYVQGNHIVFEFNWNGKSFSSIAFTLHIEDNGDLVMVYGLP